MSDTSHSINHIWGIALKQSAKRSSTIIGLSLYSQLDFELLIYFHFIVFPVKITCLFCPCFIPFWIKDFLDDPLLMDIHKWNDKTICVEHQQWNSEIGCGHGFDWTLVEPMLPIEDSCNYCLCFVDSGKVCWFFWV